MAATVAGGGGPETNPPHADNYLSDSDATSGSTSGGEESSTGRRASTAVEDSILSAYLQISSGDSSSSSSLSKIRSFLSTSLSGSGGGGSLVACLICLGRIRPADPAWPCSSGCHALFHLPCIQSWATQPLHPRAAAISNEWNCPKCRQPYARSQIPRDYLCYCGKLRDPPADPWLLPHSCGETCGKPLQPNCGHHCLLLCHPGPCPPCPQLVPSRCFCSSVHSLRRCAHKEFSCGSGCNKLLPCGSHKCPERCHPGECPPCRIRGTYACACGRTKEQRECAERGFRCETECDGMLGCGKHKCERGCHEGSCGQCPLQGRRTCPCGKKEYKGVACNAEVPTCGSTCEKMLRCGMHQCPERCHRGRCVETCRIVVVKSCRCGSLKKEVPCYQDLVCERKCQRMRDCGRHACKRRCCDGDCPTCPEICSRKLRCNNHKCPSPCHRGACAPCPLMVTISCACGETHFEVPCGLEMSQKPPKCSKPCHIARLCRHKSECRPHKCHYGACPPCRMICGEELSCGHSCKQRCHGPVPPPNPEFTLKPKRKKMDKIAESTPGLSCPPCQEVVWKSCLAQHMGEDRPMLCSSRKSFRCQNLCGNPLPCGNHYCTKPCHVIKRSSTSEQEGGEGSGEFSPSDGENRLAEPCEDCTLPCQKVRELACSHPCPLPCHSGDCPACKVLIKRSCHCGSMVHVFECAYYNSLCEKDQKGARSCGGPCHRKLSNCPHLCSEVCHPGECPSNNKCSKKVTVRCACSNLKRDWVCQDVLLAYRNCGRDPKDIVKNQFGVGLLPCDEDCARKLKVVNTELQLRPTKAAKSPAIEVANLPKRRKRRDRDRAQETTQVSKFQVIKATMWKYLLVVLITLVIIASAYYGYKGLYWLSDWMNKFEESRLANRFRRT